jgi:hypothetical protein
MDIAKNAAIEVKPLSFGDFIPFKKYRIRR